MPSARSLPKPVKGGETRAMAGDEGSSKDREADPAFLKLCKQLGLADEASSIATQE